MPDTTFACPACGRKFKWSAKMAGKQVRCKCGDVMTVPTQAAGGGGAPRPAPPSPAASSSAPPPLDLPLDPPAPRRCPACNRAVSAEALICVNCGHNLQTGETIAPRAAQAARMKDDGEIDARMMKFVSYGVTMVFLGMLAMIGAPFVGIAINATPFFDLTQRAIDGFIEFSFYGGIVLNTVGPFLCLVVPKESDARQFIYAAVGFELTALAISLYGAMATVPDWLDVLHTGVSFIGILMFVTFLRRLAFYLREDGLAEDADDLLRAGIGLIIAFLLTAVPILGCFAALAYLIGLIYFVIKYAVLLAQMNTVTAKYR